MKELAAFLLLLALMAGAIFNIGYLRDFTGELTDGLDASLALAERGDWYGAEAELRQVVELWNAADGYTHIFIRHAEIDSASDAMYELLSQVRSRDMDSASGAYEKARAHLSGIYTMERVTLGSIL